MWGSIVTWSCKVNRSFTMYRNRINHTERNHIKRNKNFHCNPSPFVLLIFSSLLFLAPILVLRVVPSVPCVLVDILFLNNWDPVLAKVLIRPFISLAFPISLAIATSASSGSLSFTRSASFSFSWSTPSAPLAFLFLSCNHFINFMLHIYACLYFIARRIILPLHSYVQLNNPFSLWLAFHNIGLNDIKLLYVRFIS